MCLITGNKTIVESKKLESQLQQKGFGEKSKAGFALDLFETLYLLKKKKLALKDDKGKKVSQRKLLELASKKEKDFYKKFVVYQDLRENGFCTKTGFKFGFDFRIYPKGKKAGQAHSEKVVQVTSQSEKFSMTEIGRMSRLATNLGTELVIAAVDSENDTNYYSIERLHPNFLKTKK